MLRGSALDELAKILKSPNASHNSKIKAARVVLAHSERVTELLIISGKEPAKINVDDLVKELQNMI